MSESMAWLPMYVRRRPFRYFYRLDTPPHMMRMDCGHLEPRSNVFARVRARVLPGECATMLLVCVGYAAREGCEMCQIMREAHRW